MKPVKGAGFGGAQSDQEVDRGSYPTPSVQATTFTLHHGTILRIIPHPSHQGAVDTLAGLATHVLQRTVLTSIPLLRVKAQNDSMAEEERSPNHDVPDWPFPTVINDEVKSH